MKAIATREPPEIRAIQERKFADLMRHVLEGNLFYQRKYDALGFSSGRPAGLSDRDYLPLTHPSELIRDLEEHPPLGTNLTFPLSRYTRMHHALSTAGTPMHWLDTAESWSWWLDCWRAAYEAAEIAADDRVFVATSFGPAVGVWAAFETGQQLGALMILGGAPGSPERLQAWLDSRATVLVATPAEAQALAGDVRLGGHDSNDGSLRLTIQACESVSRIPDGTGSGVRGSWGGEHFFQVGAAEIGAWGYSCGHGNHLHINEEEFIVEMVDPETRQRARLDDRGVQRGELVLTNLGRVGSPLIRYATGQIVELSRPPCPCGRNTAVIRCPALQTYTHRERAGGEASVTSSPV